MSEDDGLPEPWLADPAVRRWATVAVVAVAMVVSIVVAVVVDARGDGGSETAGSTSTALAVESSSTQPTSTSTTPAGPTPAVWPAELTGRPGLLGAAEVLPSQVPDATEPGIYVWSDFTGWHLWVVNGPEAGGLRGTITSDAEMGEALLTEPAIGSVTATERVTTFDLPADVPAAGFRFNPGFFSSGFSIDAEPVTGSLVAEPVRLGSALAARGLPLQIDKVPGS